MSKTELLKPSKESVENLISDVIYAYVCLDEAVKYPMEDYRINRGLLQAGLSVSLDLDMKLWEIMSKSLPITSKVGIVAPRTENVDCFTRGSIPTEKELDDHLSETLSKVADHNSVIMEAIKGNKEDLTIENKKRKGYLKLLSECAKEKDFEGLEKAINLLYGNSKYKAEVSLDNLRYTAEGLIELAGQIGYYTGGTGIIIDKLKSSVESIKVKIVWFTFQGKKYTRPFSELLFPENNFEDYVSSELITKEFMIKLNQEDK